MQACLPDASLYASDNERSLVMKWSPVRIRASAQVSRGRVGVVAQRSSIAMLLTTVVLAGCGGDDAPENAPRPTGTTLGLLSSDFANESRIPVRNTCDGQNESPSLTWTRVPSRTRSLALLMEDEDAPNKPLHWSVYDLARGSTGLKPGRVPSNAAEGKNSFAKVGYDGPCPPKGDEAHRYHFRLYALDDKLGLAPSAEVAAVRSAIEQHAIATGSLTGRYSR
jgi:Raf kinase inhibitor-like YbhB/YbcL family protein